MNNINYTFIIPHKNIPDLLQRCLNSIPRREDIQIIVIDDNSDPDKVDFEHFPGVGEPCVEVHFTKEGKGAGYARNVGLEHAKGKWLLFADADDFFEDNFISALDEHFHDDSDIIYFCTRSVDSETLEKVSPRSDRRTIIQRGKIDNLRFTHVPWGKMIRHEFVKRNKLYFEELIASNDSYFSVISGVLAKKISAYNVCIYVSTIRSDSLFFHDTVERLDARMIANEHINSKLEELGVLCRLSPYTILLKYKNISMDVYRNRRNLYLRNTPIEYIIIDLLKHLKYKCFVLIKNVKSRFLYKNHIYSIWF